MDHVAHRASMKRECFEMSENPTINPRWREFPCVLRGSRKSRKLYREHRGDPGDLWVLHLCGNWNCWEPIHFYLGTARDNVKDTIEAGKHGKKVHKYRHKVRTGRWKGEPVWK